MHGFGLTDRTLTPEEIASICDDALGDGSLDGKKVLVVIPDHTRTCPLDQMFRMITERLMGRAEKLDFMVALGTHPPLSDDAINQRVGITAEERSTTYASIQFFNHDWQNPDQLMTVGQFTKADIHEISEGLFEMDLEVRVNKIVKDYDVLLICGPVFPHEVVGFSGGNKYIFPGISGPEVLNFFHWLAAVITNPRIIGTKWTPVRKVIDRSAAMVPIERRALCMVVERGGLAGLFGGTPEEAWSAAADLSRDLHITFTERAYHTVLSCSPEMYDELWTAGKCMYKLEAAVADGGKLIIYAPHIDHVSDTHGEIISKIGYHTRDYFLKQWDDYKDYSWGVVAHSTHVKGIGTYEDGVETPRVEVILATQMTEEQCKAINLGYMDYREINFDDYKDREDEGILFIPKAGEMLYRWKDAPPALGGEG